MLDPRPAGYRAAASGVAHAALRQDHAVAILVAVIVLVAAVAGAMPAIGIAASGSTDGVGSAPRLAVGAGAGDGSGLGGGAAVEGPNAVDPVVLPSGPFSVANEIPAGQPAPAGPGQGAFLPDGTLLKPIAVDTTAPDATATVKVYRVKPGDTLTGIASRFGVKMMTLWWANNLKSKDALKPGLKLKIPPNDGLLVKVKEGQNLDKIARAYGADPLQIQAANSLPDTTVYIGQTLFIPNAQGAPMATPTPPPAPAVANAGPGTGGNSGGGNSGGGSSGGGSSGGGGNTTPVGPTQYTGGRLTWPVVGGGNYISQYYHYGHPAIDIAAEYGSPVIAAAGGRVVFAGWRSNGGGYQVWIDHGNGLYTTYNHLSAVAVGAGQSVGGGQRVGSVGQSGSATGPHCHFEVWQGFPWGGGDRVNPLAYLR